MNTNFFFYIIFISVLVNSIILISFKYLSKKINIYDIPNQDRKLHQKNTPLLGGLIVSINITIYFFILISEYFLFDNKYFTEATQFGLREFFSFMFISMIVFFIGLYDDKFNLDALKKILLLFITLFIYIGLDIKLIIESLDLNVFEINILLGSQSGLIFSIFSFLVLINALNLFDGLNMQSSGIFIFTYLILIINGIYVDISLILLLANLTFLYLNYKDQCFYGDSGIYINSYFIGYMLTKSYNANQGLSPESIFLLFLLPCIDMLRIFFIRIINNKNPFVGDRNHFHHLLKNKVSNNNSLALIIFISSISPFCLFNFFDINFLIVIILSLIMYSIIIYVFRNVTKI